MTTLTTQPVPAKEQALKGELMENRGLLADFRHDMEEMWARPFQMLLQPFGRTFRTFDKPLTAWTPTVDVFEKDGELIVRADLPGLEKKNIEVAVEEGDLVLRGERKTEEEINAADFYRVECNCGSFYRRMALPFEADPTLIAASFKNGVLEVKVPIPAEKRPETHTIPVH